MNQIVNSNKLIEYILFDNVVGLELVSKCNRLIKSNMQSNLFQSFKIKRENKMEVEK